MTIEALGHFSGTKAATVSPLGVPIEEREERNPVRTCEDESSLEAQ